MRFPSRAAAVLVAALSLAPAAVIITPAPLCRVTAEYRPLWWASDLGQLTVKLAPDCPPNGIGRVRLGNYGGIGSRATGPTEILSQGRHILIWSAQPKWRSVLWLSRSGKPYAVPIREVRR